MKFKNIPPKVLIILVNHRLAILVKLSTAFAVAASFAMQFYVPIPIILPHITKRLSFIGSDLFIEYVYRTVMILVVRKSFNSLEKKKALNNKSDYLVGLSAAIPELDLVITLVGALGCTFLAVVFPTILEMVLFHEKNSTFSGKLIFSKNCFILFVGVLGSVTGAYTTIIQF